MREQDGRKDEDHRPEPEEPEQREERERAADEPPETTRHPSRGVKHEPEPDADNLIPAEDEPGTF